MFLFRRFGRSVSVAVVAVLAGLCGPASAAGIKSIAYYAVAEGDDTAYLIDWDAANLKARVAGPGGASNGTYADDGSQKVVTLAKPLSQTSLYMYDDCGTVYARWDTHQVVVRDFPDSITETVPIGEFTEIGGCNDGRVTPFGAATDEGRTSKRLSMSARPSMSDLQSGLEMAGFSEDQLEFAEVQYAQDVVTFQGDRLKFRTTGDVVPAVMNPKKWLVLTLPSGEQRAFTRLAVDSATQGETWLMAGWVSDRTSWLTKIRMVKTLEGAGFGTVAEASRKWESSLLRGTREPFYIYLYKNGTGERVQKFLDDGTELRTPIDAWGFEGLTLWQERQLSGSDAVSTRRWQPLRNEGSKTRWVMESESWVRDGVTVVSIKPRVNYYVDTGKTVPAAASAVHKPTVPH